MAGARAKAGQAVTRSPICDPATQNRVLEAAEHFHQQVALGQPGSPSEDFPFSPGIIKVKNLTGGALRTGEICETAAKLLTTVSRRYPWLNTHTAAPTEAGPWGIVLEPIPVNGIGPIQIAGVCPALINVQATTDLWAYVNSGDDTLKGDRFWGDVRLLGTPPGTGEQLMFVKIEQSPQSWLGKTDASHAKGASGTVSVWTGTPGSESDTTYNISSVYNRFAAVGSGKWVAVTRLHRKPYLTAAEC